MLMYRCYMKKIFLLIVSLGCFIINTSCTGIDYNSGDDNSSKKPSTEVVDSDEYYVQYEADQVVNGRFNNLSANTPQGTYVITNRNIGYWSETYGPVKKGFKARVSISGSGRLKVIIRVSKNNGPFAQKATGENDGFASATYVIE